MLSTAEEIADINTYIQYFSAFILPLHAAWGSADGQLSLNLTELHQCLSYYRKGLHHREFLFSTAELAAELVWSLKGI